MALTKLLTFTLRHNHDPDKSGILGNRETGLVLCITLYTPIFIELELLINNQPKLLFHSFFLDQVFS